LRAFLLVLRFGRSGKLPLHRGSIHPSRGAQSARVLLEFGRPPKGGERGAERRLYPATPFGARALCANLALRLNRTLQPNSSDSSRS
jgi:hypothetical protein